MTAEELAERVLQRRITHDRARIGANHVYWMIACIIVAAVATGDVARFIATGW